MGHVGFGLELRRVLIAHPEQSLVSALCFSQLESEIVVELGESSTNVCYYLLPKTPNFIMSFRKRQLELESELQSLQKANLNLENLLEATKVCKRQEVSQLNKIHAETLKVGHLKQCSSLGPRLSQFVPPGTGSVLRRQLSQGDTSPSALVWTPWQGGAGMCTLESDLASGSRLPLPSCRVS